MNFLSAVPDELSRRSLLLYAAKTTLGLNILPSFLKGAEIKPGIKKLHAKE